MCRKQHKGRRFRSNNIFLKTNKNICNENICIAARVNNKKKKHEHKKRKQQTQDNPITFRLDPALVCHKHSVG